MQLEQIRSHPPPDVATGVSAGMSAQVWRDVTFLHWRYDAGTIAPLLPRGLVPDEYGGSSWVGLVGLRMVRVRLTGMPLGRWDFLETNLRLYAVDEHGQRGVVFITMEASSPSFVVGASLAARLPYRCAVMRIAASGDTLAYRTARRWPGPPGAGIAFRVRVGRQVAGTPLDHFLTARWRLYSRWHGMRMNTPIAHEPWTLHEAQALEVTDAGLFASAGLPPPTEPPQSALYAPTAHARIGLPTPRCR